MRILSRDEECEELFIQEIKKNNLIEILALKILQCKSIEEFIITNPHGGKLLNEIIYVLINISYCCGNAFKNKEKNNLLVDADFLRKINYYLTHFLVNLKVSINVIVFITNILSDYSDLGPVFSSIFDFKNIIKSLFGVNLEKISFFNQVNFYRDISYLISNIIYLDKNKEVIDNLIDCEFIIQNLFFVLKRLISYLKQKNNSNCELNTNSNNGLSINSTPNLNLEYLNTDNQYIQQQVSNNNNIINDSPFEQSYINNSHSNNINSNFNESNSESNHNISKTKSSILETVETILTILVYFVKDYSCLFLANNIKQLLKLLSTIITDARFIYLIIDLIAKLMEEKFNFDTLFDKDFFLFSEQFFSYLLKFYEVNLENKTNQQNPLVTKNISDEDLKHYNFSLKYFLLYYSMIVKYSNDLYLIESIVFDDEKKSFYKKIFKNKTQISENVRFEFVFLFYSLLLRNCKKLNSMLLRENFNEFFNDYFLEIYDNNENTSKQKIYYCLTGIALLLEFAREYSQKINIIKCSLEQDGIADIIHNMQNDSNFEISELAIKLFTEYWSNDECFYDDTIMNFR